MTQKMIKKLKTKLDENQVSYLDTDQGIKLKGNADFDIEIYDMGFELIIGLGEAHYHCDNVGEVIEILNYALAGTLRVVVKLRGNTVVGTHTQIIDSEGNICVMDLSHSFFSPFWKKKSFMETYFRNPQTFF